MKKIILFLTTVFALLANGSQISSSGDVFINDKKVNSTTVVKVGDFIKTGNNSKIKFNIGKNAFMAKSNTKFKITKNKGVKTLNVIAGGVLAVFQKEDDAHEVKTENMTAGIRGTGVYLQHENDKSYFCTCYGKTELKSAKAHEEYEASHHKMVWIKEDGSIKTEGKMVGHNDNDLRELEAFVGRIPEFDMK